MKLQQNYCLTQCILSLKYNRVKEFFWNETSHHFQTQKAHTSTMMNTLVEHRRDYFCIWDPQLMKYEENYVYFWKDSAHKGRHCRLLNQKASTARLGLFLSDFEYESECSHRAASCLSDRSRFRNWPKRSQWRADTARQLQEHLECL